MVKLERARLRVTQPSSYKKKGGGWYSIAEKPTAAPHLAHPEGCAALRIVLVTVPRVIFPMDLIPCENPSRVSQVPLVIHSLGVRTHGGRVGSTGVPRS